MKDKIIKRLLTDSRITIPLADSLLNNRPNKANIIELLLEDGDIDSAEAMTLLRDSDDSSFPFRTPNHMITLPHIDFPGTGNPGTIHPTWTITCTSDLNNVAIPNLDKNIIK